MWSIIKETDLDNFENSHPQLIEYEREYVLYESNGNCFLPRFFYSMFPSQYLIRYEDPSFEAQPINIEFTGELRKNQLPFITHGYNIDDPDISGILQGYPGIGKTVIAAHLATKYKTKTLILLDNSKLVEQWKDAFLSFTSITEEDIGIIKGKKLEVDKPIIIAMVQTLVSKAKRDLRNVYTKIKDAGVGLVFIDECHKSSSAPAFAKSSLFFNTRNIIGLSATPYNQNLAQTLMHGIMGDILYQTKAYELVPDVYFINYYSAIDPKQIRRMDHFRDLMQKKACYDAAIVESEMYAFVIQKIVEKLLASKHQIFIVCATVKQVNMIHDMLINHNIKSDKLYSKDTEVDKDAQVIVATYGFAGAGFDLKTLSAMIFASPYRGKKSTIQTIGRILRKSKGKDKAIVFDLVDGSCPTLFKGYINSKSRIIAGEFEDCNINALSIT